MPTHADPRNGTEGVGFEPTRAFSPLRLSRPVHSTTLPSLLLLAIVPAGTALCTTFSPRKNSAKNFDSSEAFHPWVIYWEGDELAKSYKGRCLGG
jgi:hypothetical protein